MSKFPIGERVTVVEGSGLASGKNATIIGHFDWRDADDGTYKCPNKNQVPLLYDDGTLGFMYKNRLRLQNG